MKPRAHPARLFVELTTRCNLDCGMCVRQGDSGTIPEGSMSDEIFGTLSPAFPHLDALVLNGIGESLLHPRLESFIASAKERLPAHAWVGFQSNGMLLTDTRAESLVGAGLDRICLSLDAVSDDRFRTIRGGEVSAIESAFAALNAARLRHGSSLMTGVEFVLMKDNLSELPAAVEWAGRQGADFMIVTQLLPYHRASVSQSAYDTNTADAIAVYEDWQQRAAAEGADLRRYLDVFMKYTRTPDEERIVGLVERMRGDAADRGVALNLERLLRRDDAWFRTVDRTFAEARRIADTAGIALTLPGTAPRNMRRCEFVEGDGAFVSWDGGVHPCYFLWHRYACYVGGIEKKVRPWVLGSLQKKDILEIWNDEGYRTFRERVLGYRFPFCFDCGFALCDYVGEAEFEQDCYIERVPCGACLWCTGLFHCLQ